MHRFHRRQDSPQTSRTLLSTVIAPNFAQDGDPAQGQTPSATSSNNFINFCADKTVTDGSNSGQLSCNPAPIGLLPSFDNAPSVKISSPRNGDILTSETTFTVEMVSRNFAGTFMTNSGQAYMTAPQQLSGQGHIMGHYHLVIEELSSFNQTTPTQPETFAFSKEVFNDPPSAEISNGLVPGSYRAFVSLHAANHQPVMLPVSQHGGVNDAVYFTVAEPSTANNRRRSLQRRRQPDYDLASSPPPASGSSGHAHHEKRQGDPLNSLTLDASSIAASFASNGEPVSGMTPSLTSTNNFINFCDSTTLPITNGAQVRDGSCNPAPLGMIVPNAARPSSKFIFPTFGTTWPANQPLVVAVFVENFEGGFRTNSATNYMAAPQQLTEENLVRGYVGIVFEQMSSFTQTNPTNPNEFTLFQALTVRDTRVGGWSTIVESGLPEGIYRVTSFLRAENHQPVLVASSAGGASGDIIYFSVVGEGGAVNGTAPIIPSSVVAPSSSSGTGPRSTAFDSAPTEPGNSSSPAPVNVGAIAGGVVAGIAALCLIVFFVIFFMRRRKASESRLQQLQPRAFDSPYGGSTTSQNPLTGPNTLGSPNASVAPYSLVSSYTASMHSSNPVSASAPPNVAHSSIPVSVPVPANATSANEKRLPRVPVSPDRASVVSAAPSYRTNI